MRVGKCRRDELRKVTGFSSHLRAFGAARAALPPLRERVPGLTGWTPYPLLGPRGPTPCGPSLRSGNRPAAALKLRLSGLPPGDFPCSPVSRPRSGPWGYRPPTNGSALGRLTPGGVPHPRPPPRAQSGVGAGLRLWPGACVALRVLTALGVGRRVPWRPPRSTRASVV
jgi:hypothetical protein